MKRLNVSFLFPFFTLVILIFALSRQMFGLFPLGKVLDPFVGAVRNEDEHELTDANTGFSFKGLHDTVRVYIDERKVPHIYAGNEEDVYFAQGYVSAYLRLWQMDFLTYVSAGRLSEIFKDGFLESDRSQRRLGIPAAAAASLKMIEQDPESIGALTAYSSGVNAFIGTLDYGREPFEYKLLDYEPEPWTNLKSVLIMKYLAKTLSGYEDDYSMSNMILALGEDRFNELFPDYGAHISPVVGGRQGKAAGPAEKIRIPSYLDYSFLSKDKAVESAYNPRLGSNSWVVSGSRSKNGNPILCNDPHLNFSLPCIWLEMQLNAPGMNVYGVSIPGMPSVVIGFNERIAWGLTNGADDVKDWYKLRLTDDYRKYELDGVWRDLDSTVEKIGVRDQRPFYDTIYRSVQGPIVFDKRFGGQHPELKNFSLRWELHRPSNEFKAFIGLNKAKNYGEYKRAIANYGCPVQNFTFACRDGTIAVDHQGRLAKKMAGQGKFILDGTRSASMSMDYIPEDSLPHDVDPSSGFLFSANQHPTGPGYQYYYNGYFPDIRANRIRELLEKGRSFDIPGMMAMQLDDVNSFAVEALPVMVSGVGRSVSEKLRRELGAISRWKGNYGPDDEYAELFELWWGNIKDAAWEKLREYPFYTRDPDNYVLLDLIRQHPNSDFFDRKGTDVREDAGFVIGAAFLDAVEEFDEMKQTGSVRWGDINRVKLNHLTKIEAFSDVRIPSAGYPDAINAVSAGWGPSWRMIVELGDWPTAYGIYAGGQSGNTGSRFYDDFVGEWNKGKYYRLNFFRTEAEARKICGTAWLLAPMASKKARQ